MNKNSHARKTCIASASALAVVLSVFSFGLVFSGPGHDHSHDKGHKHAHPVKKARVGEMAPDFTLVDQDGVKRTLSEYKGQVVVLEWTNPACPFVVRHYDAGTTVNLEKKFYGSDEKREVVWLRINSTNKNHKDFMTAKETKAWAKKVGVAGPILDDSDGMIGHLYGAKTTPHMYIVDAKGKLIFSGAIDDDPRGRKKAAVCENYVDNILTGFTSGKTVEPFANDSYGCSVKYSKK